MIEEYQFGSMTIDGKAYRDDIEVRWTGEVLDWLRADSHIIDIEDIAEAIEQNPETLIIGTGESGMAQVTEEAQKEIKLRGIELIVDKTEAAVKKLSGELKFISKERIRDEFTKMIMTKNPMIGIVMCQKLGLLKYIAPDIEKAVSLFDVVGKSFGKSGHGGFMFVVD